jgi:hypothetical protein
MFEVRESAAGMVKLLNTVKVWGWMLIQWR